MHGADEHITPVNLTVVMTTTYAGWMAVLDRVSRVAFGVVWFFDVSGDIEGQFAIIFYIKNHDWLEYIV